MNNCVLPLLLALCSTTSAQISPAQTAGNASSAAFVWNQQVSGVSARLRGISAVNERVVWASGADSTVLRTTDGGANWVKLVLPESMRATPLDFRDIDAIDASTAYLLSIGPGAASRIFKTTDGGVTWVLQYTNPDAKGFLDAMTFWDADNGLVIGDSIDGQFQILITRNGGATWNKVPATALPPALPDEGAFSASGSNIAVFGREHAWIGMGSATTSRVLVTRDAGKTWHVVATPLASSASAGIFSVAFRDAQHGVIVGGDYKAETAAVKNLAVTSDGGATWSVVANQGLSGYRSSVKYLTGKTRALIAIGPAGADQSDDDGKTWRPLDIPAPMVGFDALGVSPGGVNLWASGNKGAVARLQGLGARP